MTYYIVVRIVVIIIMIILMILGLLSVILGSIFLIKINSDMPAITNIWSNDLQHCRNKNCEPSINDNIWKNKLDVIDKKDYQPSIAKRCADLINRIVQAETTSKIVGPASLSIIGELKNHSEDPFFGALWINNTSRIVWLAFRGTLNNTLREWNDDFSYNKVNLPKAKKAATLQKTFIVQGSTSIPPGVHSGFLNVYNNFKDNLLKVLAEKEKKATIKHIIVTGHSLGGGVSTLCATQLASLYKNRVTSYTFAAPRSGGAQLCELIKSTFTLHRIVNTTDVVPNLPPSVSPNFQDPKNPYFYQHCGNLKTFTSNWKSIAKNHTMSVYTDGLILLENN